MDAINAALSFVYDNILSITMLVLLIATGIYLSLRMKFFQFRRLGYVMKNTVGSLFDKSQHKKDASSISPFQAVTNALAGTIGTGSIAGVATALVLGGPGAIFWMWISALVGMITKYSEIVLALKYREKNEKEAWVGGPMYYISRGTGKKWIAVVFAVFAMIACIGTGNATQSNSISGIVNTSLNVPTWVTGLVLTLLVGFVIIGGVKRIARINEKLVPFMAVFFILTSAVAIFVNIGKIPSAFATIFSEAFNFKPIFGAVSVHCVCGAMGTILTGFFATGVTTEKGLLYGGGFHFLGVQCLGVLSVAAYVAIVITIVFLVIKHTIGLRADKEDELAGLDVSEHGLLTAYAGFAMLPDTTVSNEDASAPVQVTGDVPVAEAVTVKKMPTFDDGTPKLTKVEIVCKESRLEALKAAMMDIGITGMTVSHVLGCGVQKGKPEYYRGVQVEANLLPKIQVDIVVSKVPVRSVIDTAKKVLYTGHIGDGKIFVYDVENVVKVRTGEEGYDALQDVE